MDSIIHEKMELLKDTLSGFKANVHVSTMTVTMSLEGITSIWIPSLVEEWKQHGIVNGMYVRVPGEKKDSRKRKIAKSFNNSVTVVKVVDGRKQCAKLFRNGTLHVTGCKSLNDSLEVGGDMCKALGCILGVKEIRVSEYKVLMTNIVVNMKSFFYDQGGFLDLSKIKQELERFGITSSYDRNIYPGIKVKIHKDKGGVCTILGFSSGNFILAGLKDIGDDVDSIIGRFFRLFCDVYPKCVIMSDCIYWESNPNP